MEISHLRVFQTVAEARSVSSAAQRLHCVQSNVTARIKGLENELEQKLFYRKPRGMILTPAGNILLSYAKQILHLEREAKKVLLEAENVMGPLQLGANESIAAVRLPKLLSQYHRLYPEVNVSLITGASTELARKVINYEIDGAFVTDEYRMETLDRIEAFCERLVLISSPGKESPVTAAQKGILLLPKPCVYRERLEHWLQQNGLAPQKKIELGSVDGMIECVAAGMGVTMLPVTSVEKASTRGTISIHHIGEKMGSVPIMFVKRKDTFISNSLSAFLELLKNKNI